MEKMVTIQCMILCAMMMITGLAYMTMEWFTVTPFVYQVAQNFWYFDHGGLC